MDRRKLLRLWADEDLCEGIRKMSRRRFSCDQDREDACAEAWERIAISPSRMSRKEVMQSARNAIEAMYRREYRRRCHDAEIESVTKLLTKRKVSVTG